MHLHEHTEFDLINYSSWDTATHGPEPIPDWVVTELSAMDTELGILKSGKEADVHLLQRAVPNGRETLLAAKRYRPAERRMFHRDAAEFAALDRLWRAGAPVPYPVQLSGTELLLEFIGDPDGTAAPRLAQCRPPAAELADLFAQCVDAMRVLAGAGYAHGDLSAFNLLVQGGRLVVIDLPQVVDIAANPRGPEYLHRDCVNICTWFRSRGLRTAEYEHLFGDLMAEAVASW